MSLGGVIMGPEGRRFESCRPDHRGGSVPGRFGRAPLAVGRAAELGAVAFREMRRRSEAAGQRHVDDAHVGLQQQAARLLEPQLHVIALGAAIEVAAEQALELAGRHAHLRRKIRRAHRILDGALHALHHRDELGVAHADARGG